MIDIGYAGALLGGVLTVLSPCSAILLPGFFAYAFSSTRALSGRTVVFYAGLATTLVPLGLAASTLGALLNEYRDQTVLVVSLLVIALGLLQLIGVRTPMPGNRGGSGKARDSTVVLSVYLLGVGYGVAGVCSGPILGSVLGVAAVGSDPMYGGVLLAVYALGMTVPVFILALLWDRLRIAERRWLRPRPISIGPIHTNSVNLVSGVLFIVIGGVMLFTAGTANLSGILDVDTQFAAESQLQTWSERIPDLAVIGGLVLVAILIAVMISRHPRRTAAGVGSNTTDSNTNGSNTNGSDGSQGAGRNSDSHASRRGHS